MSERDSLVITRYLDLPSNSGHATKSVNFQSEVTHMTKTLSTSKDIRKQDSSEFCGEALKFAECIGIAAVTRELSLYESQFYNWCSKQHNQQMSSELELEMSTGIARLHQAEFSIKAMCRVLRVACSGWYTRAVSGGQGYPGCR